MKVIKKSKYRFILGIQFCEYVQFLQIDVESTLWIFCSDLKLGL